MMPGSKGFSFHSNKTTSMHDGGERRMLPSRRNDLL